MRGTEPPSQRVLDNSSTREERIQFVETRSSVRDILRGTSYHGRMALAASILILNGHLEWTVGLAEMVKDAPLVIAADGGANASARLGVRPDAVVGDLDSIDEGTRAWIGEERMVHRPDQNLTDFEKALAFAFDDSGVEHLIVLGALGGRVDHTVGNLGVLAHQARGPNLVLATDREHLLATATQVDLDAQPGETWSFWTFDPGVRVTIEGVRWPVVDASLAVAGRPSISNEVISSQVRVVPTGGTVVVCRGMS